MKDELPPWSVVVVMTRVTEEVVLADLVGVVEVVVGRWVDGDDLKGTKIGEFAEDDFNSSWPGAISLVSPREICDACITH